MLQTNSAFSAVHEFKDELTLIKERLDLLDLKNQEIDHKMARLATQQQSPISFSDDFRDLEERLIKMIEKQAKNLAQDFMTLQ